jgi:hypothetical protein
MLGTDTVTLFKKQPDGTFTRFVVDGVQWSDKSDVVNTNGRATVTKYANVTFFEGTYDELDLPNFTEEDAIFLGYINDEVIDGRISALLKAHPRSGVIKSVNDNSNRRYLKNIKVVLV